MRPSIFTSEGERPSLTIAPWWDGNQSPYLPPNPPQGRDGGMEENPSLDSPSSGGGSSQIREDPSDGIEGEARSYVSPFQGMGACAPIPPI